MFRATLFESNTSSLVDWALVDQWTQTRDGQIWIDIEGALGARELALLKDLGCHQLSITDVQRKRHPPKIEHFEESTFILFRGIQKLNTDLTLDAQQIGFFVGENFLVTVHNGHSVSIGEFWQDKQTHLQASSPVLLSTKIMHYAAGRYLDVILNFEDGLNTIEDELLGQASEDAMKSLVSFRSRLLKLRRIFGYHEKLSAELLSWQNDISGDPHSKHACRDLFDRCERLNSLCSMYYETCGDLIDGYISISSHQLNNTMRILTVITAIFIPLGFLAGLYGMNFDYIPELHVPNAYFVLLGVMAVIATSLIVTFKRKKWL